jgi:hypothetical protein
MFQRNAVSIIRTEVRHARKLTVYVHEMDQITGNGQSEPWNKE